MHVGYVLINLNSCNWPLQLIKNLSLLKKKRGDTCFLDCIWFSKTSPTEITLYVKHGNNLIFIIVLYVDDDMLLTGPIETHIASF